MITKEEFLNEAIHTVKGEEGELTSYTVVDDYLIAGNADLVKKVIRQFKSKHGKPLLDNDAVQDVANAMGDENLVTYSYDDIATVLKGGLQTMWENQQKKQKENTGGQSVHFNFNLFGDKEQVTIDKETYMSALQAANRLKLFRLTKSFYSENSFHYSTKIGKLSNDK